MTGWSKNCVTGIRSLQDWQEDPKIRWESDIKEYLIITKINNWAKGIQARVKWKEVGEKAKTFKQRSCSA